MELAEFSEISSHSLGGFGMGQIRLRPCLHILVLSMVPLIEAKADWVQYSVGIHGDVAEPGCWKIERGGGHEILSLSSYCSSEHGSFNRSRSRGG